MLTLSTIALDSRTGLPKVHYATALDWFIICSFLYCMGSLLEFAGVHYFTKVFATYLHPTNTPPYQVGSGEVFSIREDPLDRYHDQTDLDEQGESSFNISTKNGISTVAGYNQVFRSQDFMYHEEMKIGLGQSHNNTNNFKVRKVTQL